MGTPLTAPPQDRPRHRRDALRAFAGRAFNKFNNDWTMNLTAMVAYNVLTSFFPLLLALLTILALIPAISQNTHAIASQVYQIMPSNVRSQINVEQLLNNLHNATGLLGLISVIGLLIGGTNLFGSIECAFAVIYRVKTRDFVPQHLMALFMVLVSVILLPISFASTLVLTAANTTLSRIFSSFFLTVFGQIVGHLTSLASLFVLFAVIYIVVPNLPVTWKEAWRGALIAALIMWVINTIFPFYTAHFVNTKQYAAAAIAGTITTIVWFWFFSLVLLIGAQVNSLTMGFGPWHFDISRTLAEVAASAESDHMRPRRRRRRLRFLPFSGIARDGQRLLPLPADAVEPHSPAQRQVQGMAIRHTRTMIVAGVLLGVLAGLLRVLVHGSKEEQDS